MVSLLKAVFSFTGIFLSQFAMASVMSCDLQMFVADRAGLVHASAMPTKIQSTILKSAKEIFERDRDADLSDICSALEYEGKEIYMCAVMADFVGGYETFLMTSPEVTNLSESKFPELLSTVIWGTSTNSGELVYISSDTFFFRDLVAKLSSGSISISEKLKGDSTEIDQATRQAIELGLIQPGEPIYVDIIDCKLEE